MKTMETKLKRLNEERRVWMGAMANAKTREATRRLLAEIIKIDDEILAVILAEVIGEDEEKLTKINH